MLLQDNLTMLIALIALLLTVTVTDLRAHHISNRITLGGAAFAIVVSLVTNSTDGLVTSLLGLAVGFAAFIPLYAIGGMAAGDVKLMAMVGAFLGLKGALFATGLSIIAGGLLGLLILISRKGFLTWIRRMLMSLRLLLTTGNPRLAYIPPAPNEPAALRFPYALAITIGTLAAVYWAATRGMPL
ncbi:MAG: A24 family peptidase [Pseudomonadota bacterium]|nr:A24 family peptidase [Pseudomonadota bacterium]